MPGGRQLSLNKEDNSVSTLNVPTWIQSQEMTVTYAELYPEVEMAAEAARLALASRAGQVQTCR